MLQPTSSTSSAPTWRESGTFKRMAQEAGLDIPLPITFDEFLDRKFYGKGIKGFVIEDAEALLQYAAGAVPVRLVTATGESV